MRRLARSALYVPGDHERAVAKVPSLDADIIVFDLEDGVAPEKKAAARETIRQYFDGDDRSEALSLVRINHRNTSYYLDDLAMITASAADGVMLSKVNGADDINDAIARLGAQNRADMAIWANIETPLGVTNAAEIAAQPNIAGVVAGTNDLANDLRIRRTADRAGLMHSLQTIQLAARAHGKQVLDGTFVDLEDMQGLRAEAQQGRILGFDGKTLIHPKQIDVANEVFGPTRQDIEDAKEIIRLYETAMAEKRAVTLMGSQMIEKLHYTRAKELIALVS